MVQDYDTPSTQLTFVINVTAGGSVVYRYDMYNVPLANFTQYDINEEQIYFYHDANSVNSFIRFYVTDGEHKSTDNVLHITANPVSLELKKNDKLHVFPMTRKQITADQLKYMCSDDTREINYEITIPPQFGRILYESHDTNTTREVTEFTQHHINTGRIYYEHTHAMIELKSNDSFYFDVTSKFANSIHEQIFHIEISVSSGGLIRFLPVNRLYLNEGETAPLKLNLSKVLEYLETRANIQSPELYIDLYPPMHGQIETVDGRVNVTRAALIDFIQETVLYHHDHSDTIEDKILLSVYLIQGNIFLCNLTIPVKINPINDHPFYLVTQSPQMSVVEGENRTITRKELYTEDVDTEPADITYDIISGPTLGALLKISDEGIAQDIIAYGNKFSQLDINENRILYLHYGIPQSTTFYFRVSDGKYSPSSEIFNLKVIPAQVGPGMERDIVYIQQGQNTALIKPRNFAVDTNADKNRLIYNITGAPLNGVLLRDSRPISQFTYGQLNDNKIRYLQNDMNKSNDNFKVSIYIPNVSQGALHNVEVQIIVEPIIKINAISISSEDKIRLTTSFTDDNPIRSKLNPKIVITRVPDHGKLKKIVPNSRDSEHLSAKDITSFSYKDLKSGYIYFIARKLPDDVNTINDYFEYVLYLNSAQPGQAFVSIEIYKVKSQILGDGNSDVNSASFDSSNPINYFFILLTLVGMFILVLVIILFVRCHLRNKKNVTDKDFPPPLPRPPDFMNINNNRMYSASDCGDSIPVTASSTPLPVVSTIPHCKIIPIGGLEDSESDEINNMIDGQGHLPSYIYGEENDDWSSSCDVGNEVNYSSIIPPPQVPQRMNPLLRRNQYWV